MSTQTQTTDQLGPRGSTTINSSNRGACRRWLTARGARYAQVANLTMHELNVLWNDTTDQTLRDLLRQSGAPMPQQTAAAAADPNQYPTEPIERTEPAPDRSHTPPASFTLANNAPAPHMTTPAQNTAQQAALQALLNTLTPSAPALDEARIIELISEHAPRPEPRTITIKIADRPPITTSRQHYKFPLLMATLAARVPSYLVGPAGTGKTHAAHSAATALGLDFAAISVGPMTSKGDLFGMRDAHGIYHKSDLVKIAENGGVFLFDEFDAGNAGVLTSINMLLANGSFSTPAGMIEKHADFVPIFALNTYGTGASREYVGRQQLDAATLDRGAFMDWPLDEGLEASLVGFEAPSPSFLLNQGGTPQGMAWLSCVQAARRRAAEAGLRHVISPRASLYGYQLAAAGVGLDHIWQMLIVKGLDAASAAKLV